MVSNKSHTGFVGEMVEFKLILRCTEKNVKKKKKGKKSCLELTGNFRVDMIHL